jgi:hypothetical protein
VLSAGQYNPDHGCVWLFGIILYLFLELPPLLCPQPNKSARAVLDANIGPVSRVGTDIQLIQSPYTPKTA